MNTLYTYADMEAMRKGAFEEGKKKGAKELAGDVLGLISIIILIGLLCIAIL